MFYKPSKSSKLCTTTYVFVTFLRMIKTIIEYVFFILCKKLKKKHETKKNKKRSLDISIFLYACETWTLIAELERKIQATEMRCFRRPLVISYRDHVTNEEVRNRIMQAIGPYDDLLSTVMKRKLRWYGHIARSTGLAKMILQRTVQGGRRKGRH